MAVASVAPLFSRDDEFEPDQSADLLRFTTAGSVDDGKSTLIGRLLYDSRNVYEDQLEAVSKASVGRNAGPIDFSLLTDGLRAEREQGITIDVAHRYFTTAKRKFIIADTPGHEQYTRNMVTGASNAELAIVLVDARKGLLAQSRRHAYLASLLGLHHLVVAVNKMDLVGYDENTFRTIENDFRNFLFQFQTLEPFFLPISALAGDNVVHRSTRMPWFTGPSLLEHLEQVPVRPALHGAPFRFPVQRVVRPNLDFRGYAGTVASGSVQIGDSVVALPSGSLTSIARISTFDGERERAEAGEAVTVCLADNLDLSRGDMLVAAGNPPLLGSAFRATLVWLNETPAALGKRYRLKASSRQVWAEIRAFDHRVNIHTLAAEPADSLQMNAIGSAQIETARALAFDSYGQSRNTGSFILIDPATNATVAAGMIVSQLESGARAPSPHTFSWRIENGALQLNAAGCALSRAFDSNRPHSITDPQTAELVARLLDALQIDLENPRGDA